MELMLSFQSNLSYSMCRRNAARRSKRAKWGKHCLFRCLTVKLISKYFSQQAPGPWCTMWTGQPCRPTARSAYCWLFSFCSYSSFDATQAILSFYQHWKTTRLLVPEEEKEQKELPITSLGHSSFFLVCIGGMSSFGQKPEDGTRLGWWGGRGSTWMLIWGDGSTTVVSI